MENTTSNVQRLINEYREVSARYLFIKNNGRREIKDIKKRIKYEYTLFKLKYNISRTLEKLRIFEENIDNIPSQLCTMICVTLQENIRNYRQFISIHVDSKLNKRRV